MTTSEQNAIPQPGSIVRYAAWNGVVLDVFASTSSGKHILQIMFAKNIYKQQPAELHVYEDLRGGLLLPSSREALDEELKRLNENALGEVDKLLSKITTPVEVRAVATGE
jgi:hypothetical protein